MTLTDLIEKIISGNITTLAALILLAMTFIQITPLKINPWSWLARKFGKAINHDIMIEVDEIKKDVQEIRNDRILDKEEAAESKAFDQRNRILRFADELRIKIDHSEEYFNQILEDVDAYESYCSEHEGYKNSKANDAIALVREVYHECKANNKFI